MSFLPHVDYLHAVAGLMVGVLVGLTGVGGGSLMTPLLVLMFGINPQTAVGTDLLYAATTKTVGSAVHGWRETVDWRIMRRLACGSVPTAVVTLGILAWVGPIAKHTQLVVLVILAVMLALTSLAVIFQKQMIALAQTRKPMDSPHVIYSTAALGAVIGLAVSLSSVGAGAIGVTALLMMYPNLPIARIVGTDIAHAVPLALVAGLGHWMIGDVNLVLLFSLLCGSIPGVIAGSLLSSRAPDRWLRPALAVVLMLSSWQLFAKSIIGDKQAKHDKPAAAAAATH